MSTIDVDHSFYVDAVYDADRSSSELRDWHARLWSKAPLPGGGKLAWRPEARTNYLTCDSAAGQLWVSSDTIATTHASRGKAVSDLSDAELLQYEKRFYTIGGFIVFPVHQESLNQVRGRTYAISDRFDLTLECIRRHYLGALDTPLGDVLQVDADFFRLFGEGRSGFASYVDFFHLQDLVAGDSITWFDGFDGEAWSFDRAPLPQSAAAYRRYLDNVLAFVTARNARIRTWCEATADLVDDAHEEGQR